MGKIRNIEYFVRTVQGREAETRRMEGVADDREMGETAHARSRERHGRGAFSSRDSAGWGKEASVRRGKSVGTFRFPAQKSVSPLSRARCAAFSLRRRDHRACLLAGVVIVKCDD